MSSKVLTAQAPAAVDYRALDDLAVAALCAKRDRGAIAYVIADNNQRLFRAAWSILKSRADAEEAVGQRIIAEQPPGGHRERFILYCRQNGLWTKLISGLDPDADPKALEALCPLRNVSESFPPTFLVHGTDDTDVPCEQSELMDKELSRQGVEHELIVLPSAGHGFGGGDPVKVAQINQRALAFLDRHLR